MRVIKSGTLPNRETCGGGCPNCGCVVRCESGEGERLPQGGRVVTCPTEGCRHDIVVYLLPTGLADRS